eukprot:scaffold1483_cov374-Pavlova_lutheri.AAC.24
MLWCMFHTCLILFLAKFLPSGLVFAIVFCKSKVPWVRNSRRIPPRFSRTGRPFETEIPSQRVPDETPLRLGRRPGLYPGIGEGFPRGDSGVTKFREEGILRRAKTGRNRGVFGG